MKMISFTKVALITLISIVVMSSLIYFNSLQFMGPRAFLNTTFGEHTFIYPNDVGYDLLMDAYHHNEEVAKWRMATYRIDDNGWKLDFPSYLENPVPEKVAVAGDMINSGTIPEPQ